MGITRKKVLEVARDLGMRVEEREVLISELDTAAEVFFTSSIKGALPIVSIDGKVVGNGQPGPKTKALSAAFAALIAAERVQ